MERPLTPLQLRQLRLIYAAAHALNTVTSNALQMTREWDQLEEPEARPFSVTKLLSEVQDVVRTLAAQKGLEVNFIRPNVDRRWASDRVAAHPPEPGDERAQVHPGRDDHGQRHRS